jgi:hypothetical protein
MPPRYTLLARKPNLIPSSGQFIICSNLTSSARSSSTGTTVSRRVDIAQTLCGILEIMSNPFDVIVGVRSPVLCQRFRFPKWDALRDDQGAERLT